MNTVPAEQMITYRRVSAKAAAGACISRVKAGAIKIITAVRITDSPPNRQMPLPITRPASSRSPAPIFRPTNTVSPMASPVTTKVRVYMI